MFHGPGSGGLTHVLNVKQTIDPAQAQTAGRLTHTASSEPLKLTVTCQVMS